MDINFDINRLKNDRVTEELVRFLRDNEALLDLENSQVYYDFPVLKDTDDKVIIAKVLIASRNHGLILIFPTAITNNVNVISELGRLDSELEHTFSLVFSRLVRNKDLRKGKTELAFHTNTLIFAPNLEVGAEEIEIETKLATNLETFKELLSEWSDDGIPPNTYAELLATLEGAKGIIRPQPRDVERLEARAKGALANRIESEIANFDRTQKHGYMSVLDGLQRVRGIAGSGKTVVLAMKAALTHLREPNARIVYTFYTKSLYQHIKRLITRFYRQFDDRDPDWTRLRILHGWGGYTGEGVYFNACVANDVTPINLDEARRASADPFDYACEKLLRMRKPKPMYDYLFVDEGQDFPDSFIKLCIACTEGGKVVYAYDDLQTIFQPTAPSIQDIQPQGLLTEDVILYKCYRNPREILLCAHALGFGVYGRFVQMLENREQWGDIGYRVLKGDFVPGSETIIERPVENSLLTISANQRPNEIIQVSVFKSFNEEVDAVVRQVTQDLKQGLRPDDVLVVVVDDRNAKDYLQSVASRLADVRIISHNLHADRFNIREFQRDGHVTLSTVHKAKGNEAFMVYVIGIDALNSTYAGVRERNMLFTAITRAKGWVRMSGIGKAAQAIKKEVDIALDNFPYLRFEYPSQELLKIIKRDLQAGFIRKQIMERKLDEVLDEMSPEEIMRFLEQRGIEKGTKKRKK